MQRVQGMVLQSLQITVCVKEKPNILDTVNISENRSDGYKKNYIFKKRYKKDPYL